MNILLKGLDQIVRCAISPFHLIYHVDRTSFSKQTWHRMCNVWTGWCQFMSLEELSKNAKSSIWLFFSLGLIILTKFTRSTRIASCMPWWSERIEQIGQALFSKLGRRKKKSNLYCQIKKKKKIVMCDIYRCTCVNDIDLYIASGFKN